MSGKPPERAPYPDRDGRLPDSDQELREFIDQATVGLRWVDPDGRILWANQAELDMVGCSEQEYVGHHIAEFFVEPRAAADIPAADIPLWEALRECRQRLALEHNVPPYVIFHDKTLRQMLSERTADTDAFLHLSGVGQAKLERYGDEFMAVIREHA